MSEFGIPQGVNTDDKRSLGHDYLESQLVVNNAIHRCAVWVLSGRMSEPHRPVLPPEARYPKSRHRRVSHSVLLTLLDTRRQRALLPRVNYSFCLFQNLTNTCIASHLKTGIKHQHLSSLYRHSKYCIRLRNQGQGLSLKPCSL